MVSTEEETGFPWRSAYLQMNLLEAMYFSANAKSLVFVSHIRMFAFRVENASLQSYVGIPRTQGSCMSVF